jgi:hypothetical protein
MSPKDAALNSLNQARSTLETYKGISEETRQELFAKIDKCIANVPEGTCGSPEVVLAVHIMRDVYLEVVKGLMTASCSQ